MALSRAVQRGSRRGVLAPRGSRLLSASAPGGGVDLYSLLGVPRGASREAIKSAFYCRAKEAHPDVRHGQGHGDKEEFIRLAAAYEVLSDPQTRQLYDMELQSTFRSKSTHQSSSFHDTKTPSWNREREAAMAAQSNAVPWLRRYRLLVTRAVHGLEIESNEGHVSSFDHLGVGEWTVGATKRQVKGEFISALSTAYFGPPLDEEMLREKGLPECFEGEERAAAGVGEVLHLVHGRRLLGVVRERHERLIEVGRDGNGLLEEKGGNSRKAGMNLLNIDGRIEGHGKKSVNMGVGEGRRREKAYPSLELELHGRVVATAERMLVRAGMEEDEEQDCKTRASDYVVVYGVEGDEGSMDQRNNGEEGVGGASSPVRYKRGKEGDLETRKVLGKIFGLASRMEGMCPVEGEGGERRHLLSFHNTPLVRHMLFYRQEEGRQLCECRLRRAWLPPSRYWLFEPRCPTHDIGGWYFEIFPERDRTKGHHMNPYAEMFRRAEGRGSYAFHSTAVTHWKPPGSHRLHPAMYIFGAAYKTLDEEEAKLKGGGLAAKVLQFYSNSKRRAYLWKGWNA